MSDGFYQGARMALRLAREYEREAYSYDVEWYRTAVSEAFLARERARWYLEKRRERQQEIE